MALHGLCDKIGRTARRPESSSNTHPPGKQLDRAGLLNAWHPGGARNRLRPIHHPRRKEIPVVIADINNSLIDLAREILADLMDQLREHDKRITAFDERIDAVFKSSVACQRVGQIEGVGPKTATVIVAAVSDPRDLVGISPPDSDWFSDSTPVATKRSFSVSANGGERHPRTLLTHDARAVLRTAPTKHDKSIHRP